MYHFTVPSNFSIFYACSQYRGVGKTFDWGPQLLICSTGHIEWRKLTENLGAWQAICAAVIPLFKSRFKLWLCFYSNKCVLYELTECGLIPRPPLFSAFEFAIMNTNRRTKNGGGLGMRLQRAAIVWFQKWMIMTICNHPYLDDFSSFVSI